MSRTRVGFGCDVHQLVKDRPLIIGGVSIKHSKGALGHSDADVLLHAIIDALLGAAGMDDIGTHYPDNDPKFKNIDSKILLAKTLDLINSKGYVIGNVDSTVVLQQPKLRPFIPEMRKQIAEILGVDETDVSVKAKTNEQLGFVGREEGVAAYAVVLIETVS